MTVYKYSPVQLLGVCASLFTHGRTSFVAIILALVSARLSARYESLALKAALFAMLAWVVGMTLAVITENPLF